MIRSFRFLWAFSLSLALAAPAYAGTAELLRDIQDHRVSYFNPTSEIRGLFAVRNKVAFVAFSSATTPEVWVSDGTGPGTRILHDTCPTADCDYIPEIVGTANGIVFWVAQSREDGPFRLWGSDGTRAGTRVLTPVDPPPGVGYVSEGWSAAVSNRGLYFGSCTTERGCELWHSDGTVAGTRVVERLEGAATEFHGMRVVQNRLYFFLGSDLWISDGTAAGTVQLASIGYPRLLTPAADRLYFLADDGNGRQLWVSDGTSRGTRSLTQMQAREAFDNTSWIKASGNRAYFVANDVVHGYELWRSDGTPQGTRPISDFGYYQALRSTGLEDLEEIGNRVVFAATDGITGNRLWATDGRPESTAPLTSPCTAACSVGSVVKVGERLLFLNDDAVWSTDGTAAGTRTVWARNCRPDGCSLPELLQPLLGKAVFTAKDSHSTELWWTDGTTAGTKRLTDIPAGSPLSGLVASGQRFFFEGSTPHGEEIWVTDGRETRQATNTLRWAPGSEPTELVATGDRLFFQACEGEYLGLWSSTGLPQTTIKVRDFLDSCGSRPFIYPTAVGGRLFFRNTVPWDQAQLWSTDGGQPMLLLNASASEDTFLGDSFVAFQGRLLFTRRTGDQLAMWKSDGTLAGTSEVFKLPLGLYSAESLTLVGDEVYFRGSAPGRFDEVWRTDGTQAGTRKVAERTPLPRSFTRVGSAVFFATFDGLWKTDGTLAGTARVRTLPGEEMTDLTELQGNLYFLAPTEEGWALWRSDGTEAGTIALRTFPQRRFASEPPVADLTVFAGRLFFSADDGAHGIELWTSDGTAAGTRMAVDILPGAFSSQPRELTTAGGKLFFSANDGVHGAELWESDGAEAGTRMVQDLAPDVASSSPEHLTAGGRYLYFSADDGISGREPWVLDLTGPVGCQPSSTRLCLSGGRYQVEAFWRDFQGNAGRGQAVPLTGDTGYFWFFDDANVETVVKVLDGRGSNGHVWVFYGALSNVEYRLTVTDTQTGLTRQYFNPLRQFASVGDTHGFGPLGAYSSSPAPSTAAPSPLPLGGERTDPAAATGACQASPERLCLNGNRFAVEVSWRDFQNRTGKGKAVNLTADTGYFWFFDAANVELVTKVLDGTDLNGKYWFFYGALSNVEYTVTVTDTQTGRIKTYTNPRGRFASVGDTQAF